MFKTTSFFYCCFALSNHYVSNLNAKSYIKTLTYSLYLFVRSGARPMSASIVWFGEKWGPPRGDWSAASLAVRKSPGLATRRNTFSVAFLYFRRKIQVHFVWSAKIWPLMEVLFSSYYKTCPNSRPGGDFVPKKISDPPKLPTRWGFLSKINWRPGPIKANPRENVFNIKVVLKGQMVM